MKPIWAKPALQKLLGEKAKELGIRMHEAQTLLSQERFLARLAKSPYGSKYVWKGGSLLLRTCSFLELPRYTVDIDLLARGISIEDTVKAFTEACQIDLGDGFVFGKIESSPMKREAVYGGERFTIEWKLFDKNNSQRLQIDVAAGDSVNPLKLSSDELFICPTESESFTYLVYPLEFIATEKIETIFRFGLGNTRVKDLIDLWNLSKANIPTERLRIAIGECFENRQTPFDLVKLKSILTDTEYLEVVDDAISRNFEDLRLPEAKSFLGDILLWCETLGASLWK